MPRRLRIHLPGGFYHVTLRGNHQQDIFVKPDDRLLLNRIVARALEKFDTRLHAYCWMSNHLHLLIQAGTEPIGAPMRQIAAEFARAMQGKLETTGHFFERRYHAKLVDADAYLLELVRYIHLNPVRARIAWGPGEFRWSSHHAYIGTREEAWVTTDFALRMFGSNRARAIAAYQAFLNAAADESVLSRFEDRELAVLGDDQFVARVQRISPAQKPIQDLKALINEACERFAVEAARLHSPLRDPYLVKVRGWIGYQAAKRNIATLAAVARVLGRDEATLRYAMRAYPSEME